MRLARTPPDRLTDARGRPYFLWDAELTIDQFRERLRDPDPEVRAYMLGKLMRQAKPDDVLGFASLDEIEAAWPAAERYLGDKQPFWAWLRDWWRARRGDR